MIQHEREKEKQCHQSRMEKDEEFYKEIEDHIFQKMQIYSESKIEIEEKIQKFQMYMEMNKARIRLNQETIEYNVSVLTGRKDDNEDLKEHQNKKLRTLERKVREVATQVKNDLKTH